MIRPIAVRLDQIRFSQIILEPNQRFVELFQDDSQFVNKVRTAFSCSGFA